MKKLPMILCLCLAGIAGLGLVLLGLCLEGAASGAVIASGIWLAASAALYVLARQNQQIGALEKKKRSAEQLNESLRTLAHHQRLETIGTLTSSIAHEFNNLLTPIMGYSLMALEKLSPEQEEIYDDMLEVYNTSRKAKLIISRLSDLSRKQSENSFRQVSIDQLIRKTLDVATPAKPKDVQIRLDLNCWDQRIRANEIQLNQMLLNLILNGFQAMAAGEGSMEISSSFDADFIHIQVADSGCGIPEAVQERIFEPFFTTKESGKGTGLGLAIVAQVVEDHQGHIRVESQPGKGTRFHIFLPRSFPDREEGQSEKS